MMFRRVGYQFEAMEANAHWSEDWFRHLHSEDYISKLAGAGFNCVTTHFHKGFGMEAEAGEMEMARQLIELCHRYGIRVFTYVQSLSIMYETFLAEVPSAESWLQKDRDGKVPTYGDQYWRVLPCLSNDDYVGYVREVVEKAIKWANADGIQLDNTGVTACQCECCQRKFRQYLEEHHPEPDRERFGIPNLDLARIAVCGGTRDPIYQESIRFRCDVLTQFIRDTRRYVRDLNPEAAVVANVTIGSPLNFYEVYGVDYSNSARAADVIIAENGDFPTVEDEVLITQIRYYKAGHATGAIVIPSNWLLEKGDTCVLRMPQHVEEVKLDLAEAAAYGRRCVGATWAGRATEMGQSTFYEREDVFEAVRSYNAFFRKNESLYVDAESLANVATFRNFSSLAFNYDAVYASLAGFEQTLIQNQVPFEVLFTGDLDRLCRFDVVILPNILCMSDDEIERIRAFVASGGGLVATGETSLFDENHRQRRDYGLADVFGASYHRYADTERILRKGRVVFAPGAPERVDCNRFNYQTRAPLPDDHEALVGYVRDTSHAEFPIEVNADRFVTTEICQAGSNVVVHLINHRNSRTVKNVLIRLAARLQVEPRAQELSVDAGTRIPLDAQRDDGGHMGVTVPELQTYSVVLFGN